MPVADLSAYRHRQQRWPQAPNGGLGAAPPVDSVFHHIPYFLHFAGVLLARGAFHAGIDVEASRGAGRERVWYILGRKSAGQQPGSGQRNSGEARKSQGFAAAAAGLAGIQQKIIGAMA